MVWALAAQVGKRGVDRGPGSPVRAAMSKTSATGSGGLSQRRVVLVLFILQALLAWTGGAYYLLADAPVGPEARPAFYGAALVTAIILVLHWRGWDQARYLSIVLHTVVIGALVPLPSEQFSYLPQAMVIPSAMALVVAGPIWVVGSAVGVVALVFVRLGGFTSFLGLTHLLPFGFTIGCLVVSRLVIDAAGREAEARAEQAERARHVLEQQADELRRQQASQHFHATLLGGVEQPVLATDPRGTVIYWNRGAEHLFGWPADTIVGRRFADLDRAPYDLPTDEASWYERALEGPQTRDLEGRRRDGTPVPTSVSSWPFRDVDGTLLGRVAVITDLTERKAAERQRELFDQGQKLRALGQMAGGIAHDLNQALAVVTGYVELALDDLDGLSTLDDDPETRAFLETAAQAAV